MPLASVARLSPRLLPMQHFHDVDIHHVGCLQNMIDIWDQALHVLGCRQIDLCQVVAADLQHQNVDVRIYLRRQSANAQKTYDNAFG